MLFLRANESDFTNFDEKKPIHQLNHAFRRLPKIFSNITYSSDDLSVFKEIFSSDRFFTDYQPTGLKLKSQENRKIREKLYIFAENTTSARNVLWIFFFISIDITLNDDVMWSFLNLKPSLDLFSEGMRSQREYAGLWRSDRRLITSLKILRRRQKIQHFARIVIKFVGTVTIVPKLLKVQINYF